MRTSKHIMYKSSLTALARQNRKNPSFAETKLWREVLSRRQLEGFKFLRQKPLLEYIVDFYCSELLLVVEADGDSHAKQEAYDHQRTAALEKRGIEVVRFTNDEITGNLEGVYSQLMKIVERKKSKKPPLPPP